MHFSNNFISCVTWCYPRPWKTARESCSHVFARSWTLFPPAPLPCHPYKLWPAVSDARASRRTDSSRCGSLLPLPLRGASALLPPPLRGAAACHNRQHGAEEIRELADRPEQEHPAWHLLRSVCAITTVSGRYRRECCGCVVIASCVRAPNFGSPRCSYWSPAVVADRRFRPSALEEGGCSESAVRAV